MCGIVGIVDLQTQGVDVSDLKTMSSLLQHRGPDGAAYALLDDGAVGLAHLRLGIIDLEGGQQPLYNEDYSVCLSCNGEIYDYRELRTRLMRLGHVFRTSSDSEVILHLYEEYGLDFFRELNGEFAFLLWDQKRSRLIAARDRAGVKPLFYRVTRDEVLFASEAKAILALPRVPRQLSKRYLTGPLFGSVTAECSAFEGIESLKPGHHLIVEHGIVNAPRPYWKLDFAPDYSMTREEAEEGVRQHFTRAVERRMVADVEVGTYLSGGLDSTLVCGLMAARAQSMQAFNIGFGGSIYDESSLAARIAGHYGTRFKTLDCPVDSLAEDYLGAIFHIEMALANPSAIGKLRLSRLVRSSGVKVCIIGEGSDEVFGGYAYFKLERLWRMLESTDPGERARAKLLMRRFEKLEHRSRSILWDSDLPWKTGARPFGYASYHQIRAQYAGAYVPRLYRSAALGLSQEHTPAAVFEHAYDAAAMARLDPFNAARTISFGQLAGYIIPSLGDRVEMANSVECRTPFLDRDLIEFSARVPPEYFLDIDRLKEKDLLRRAFGDLLPSFMHQEHKHPFLSPNWLALHRTRRGRELFGDLLSQSAIRRSGIFEPRFLKLVMSGWKLATPGSKFFKRVDTYMGFALGVQALERYFVANRPAGDASFAMQDRTRRPAPHRQWPGRAPHEPELR